MHCLNFYSKCESLTLPNGREQEEDAVKVSGWRCNLQSVCCEHSHSFYCQANDVSLYLFCSHISMLWILKLEHNLNESTIKYTCMQFNECNMYKAVEAVHCLPSSKVPKMSAHFKWIQGYINKTHACECQKPRPQMNTSIATYK